MSSNDYNWVASIYGVRWQSPPPCAWRALLAECHPQIAYIIFEAPSNLLLKKMSPHNWQARIFCTWGIITACHAAARNRHDLYAMRFLLGSVTAPPPFQLPFALLTAVTADSPLVCSRPACFPESWRSTPLGTAPTKWAAS